MCRAGQTQSYARGEECNVLCSDSKMRDATHVIMPLLPRGHVRMIQIHDPGL